MKPWTNYQKDLLESLKDPKEAAAYLNAALESGDKRAFLLALRNVLQAQGGMSKISERCKMNRVSLYKMLSKNGNPGFINVLQVLQTAGIYFQVIPRLRKKRHL